MHHLIFISILIFFNALIPHPIKAETNSFGFDLFHRDSKFSPFYNKSMTESELSRKSFLRSLNHLNSSTHIDGKFVGSSDLTNMDGDYFMSIYIGESKVESVPGLKEPIKLLGYPSMSDDLTWVRCSPCSNCRYEHQLLYNPKNSYTYHPINYGSEKCEPMERMTKGGSNECKYKYHSSGEKFESSGVLSTEAFYLKSPDEKNKKFSDIVFGCDDTHKSNFKHGVQAVVGLGQGSKLSLVSQLGKKIGEKFSYCLAMQSVTDVSKIRFGSDIKLYNRDKEFKAKITYDSPYPFYYLSLEAISININGKKIKIGATQQLMRVDIQTAVTAFPSTIYNELLNAFKAEAGITKSFKHQEYGTCFYKSKISRKLPDLIFHFKARLGSIAELHLHHKHFLLDWDDMVCMSIVSKEGIVSVLGNKAQVDVQMIFDLKDNVLTFAPLDCLKFSV